MAELATQIEQAGPTQAQAARKFSVTPPRVSDLVRGEIDLFSIGTPVNILSSAGLDLDVIVRPTKTS